MADIQPVYSGSHALVVGINSYADPRFVSLGKAEDDATSFAKLLAAPPYNFEVTRLLGRKATRQAILEALFNLRRTQPDDRVIVYFAGHGYTLSDRFNKESGYLAAADTIPEQDFTALEMEEVTGLVRYAAAKHIAFIFDACFSGQALGLTRAPSVAAEKFKVRRAYQVISAGAGDQTVADFQSMTTRMITALANRAMDEDGIITFSEVGLYLQQTIAAESGQTQIPQFGHLRGSQGGDFIFYEDTGPRLPFMLEETLRSGQSNSRRGAVADLFNIARGGDKELAALAVERLTQIAKQDPDARVRAAAQRYFEEQDAGYDSTQDVAVRDRIARTPKPAPAPAFWEKYRWFLIGGAALITVMAVLLVIALSAVFRPVLTVESPGATEIASTRGAIDRDATLTPTPPINSPAQIQEPIDLPAVLLDVPYLSQRDDITAGFSRNDSGPTCLAMVLGSQGTAVTTDAVYEESGQTSPDFVEPDTLAGMGLRVGLFLEPHSLADDTSLDTLKAWLDEGKPVIVYVDYDRILDAGYGNVGLPPTLSKDDPTATPGPTPTAIPRYVTGEHYVVVIGYDDHDIYVHDPAWASDGGKRVKWPDDVFESAWIMDGTSYQAVALVPGDASEVAQVAFVQAGSDTGEIIADGYDAPVGTAEERRGDQTLPDGWFYSQAFAFFSRSPFGDAYHTGVDLVLDGGSAGQPVYAPASGVVVYAQSLGTWGKLIVIRHDPLADGTYTWTRYAHLQDILIDTEQRVERGEQIGTVGSTGNASGPHLHFDVAITNILEVNPGNYPGENLQLLQQNYTDPIEFISAHRPKN